MFTEGIIALNNEHTNDGDYVPLKTQEVVATYIVKDAKGSAFKLDRIGPFDYFPEYYDQAYQFLILSKGGKVDLSAKLKYTIYDANGIFIFKNE